MKKRLLMSGLVLLLVWGSYHALVWLGAQRTMNQLAQQWSEHGDLRWEGVRTSSSGQVKVQGLQWYWFDITQPVTATALHLELPGPVALLQALWRGQWPDQARVQLESVQLQLEPDLFRPWARARPSRLKGQPLLALAACGERRVLAPTDFLQMGIDRFALNLTLTYDQAAQRSLGIDLDAGYLGRLAGFLDLDQQDIMQWAGATGEVPAAKSASLRLNDGGFMGRLATYCAAREDKTREDWVELSSERWVALMTEAGTVPTESLQRFYRHWLSQGGELALEWQPDPEQRAALGERASAQAWLQAQGLSLRHNNERVPEPGVALEPGRTPEPVIAEPVRDPELERIARYYDSELERAAAWIDRRVRLTLTSGRVLEGRLLSRDDTHMLLHKALEGGEMMLPVPLESIKGFAVWRRGDDPGRPMPVPEESRETRWLERHQPIPLPARPDDPGDQ
ncbi:MAG: hypothetical protein EA349_11220 [Halomonadaceae bacterium]|nr:MAG: hypothetical protein EA349_11220 [Halomonadaceae bacterium]